MSINSSRRAVKTKKESIYREIGSGMFIAIRTIDELEDIISTSEAYMTDPTAIFNSDNTKVLFYYNTKGRNEIEEMETLFKRTVKKGSTITLSDAFYLDESSGDDTTYDLSGTYKFEKYDATTKTIIASPISINKQSDTYLTYHSKYWTGSLLWTTSDPIHTRTSSYEIVNFLGNTTEHSFASVFGDIQENDKIEVRGVGTFTVVEYKVDADEEWERIVVKEPIPEKDLLGEKTFITILRTDRNQPSDKGRHPHQITAIKDYSKIKCDTTSNVHWMGSARDGYCMEGAEHQQSRSTAGDDALALGREARATCCRTGNPNNYSYSCAMSYNPNQPPHCVRTEYSDCRNVICSEEVYDNIVVKRQQSQRTQSSQRTQQPKTIRMTRPSSGGMGSGGSGY